MTPSPQPTNSLRALMRVPVPWVFVLAYLVGVGVEYALPPHRAAVAAPGLGVAGWALLALGVAVATWGQWTFRRARTTTVPGKLSSRLVTWGPYRFSRNPMYVGLILVYLGEAGLLRQWGPVLLLPLVVAYIHSVVIPVEEGRLSESFGGEYDRYRAGVRRWL